ncbi:MAG: DUF4860 domain-containing protein [Oscillospiraceae bacterium]|nr:DUF4860 domain-containing protein [Oscillospiraceae bacterium]
MKKGRAGTAAALMIFCVFAMTVLTVLMLGAGVYKNISDTAKQDYEERVCLSYIWSKVKNMDDAGGFYIADFQGQPALCFDEVFGDDVYRTVIYHYEGWLRELFFDAVLTLPAGSGAPIVQVESLRFEEWPGGLVSVMAGSDQLLLTPRSGAIEVTYE